MTNTLLKRASVARRLGLSGVHVGRLDHELRPIRVDGTRIYSADVVDAYAARRHANPPRIGRPKKEMKP